MAGRRIVGSAGGVIRPTATLSTVSEELPRHEAEGSHCADCSSVLDPWEGQAGARKYAFNARDIAHALNLIAAGSSYRSRLKRRG